MPDNLTQHFIEVGQLRVGLYIHLDLGWMDHPFTMSNFKLKDEDQIAKIKKIGLKRLRYDPLRSDCEPLPLAVPAPATISPAATADLPDLAPPAATEADAELPDVAPSSSEAEAAATAASGQPAAAPSPVERLRQLHRALDDSEKKFMQVGNSVREATRNILQQPKLAVTQAEALVNDMVDCVLNESEIAIHAINGNRSDDAGYQHSLNVTVLVLMMAKSLDMSEQDARTLGLAALFHDIGKMEIPDKILMKKEAFTKSEQAFYEQHSEFGARIVKQAGMSDHVARIIMQHHEFADGSGYPKRLRAEQTDPLARLVALVSGYDNLCNPKNIQQARTPYESLAYMFANQRTKYDEGLLKRMIKSLGIYPPGSIVQLSNGLHGVVIAVNPNKPLRPFVMLHDSLVDRNSPQLLDLREEPGINICLCLRPNQLPADALDYLNPRKRISYFVDTDSLQKAQS